MTIIISVIHLEPLSAETSLHRINDEVSATRVYGLQTSRDLSKMTANF